ncbi:SpaH/EbpB family LPXTG-anchored major pilin [uncultured Clostridium sp.]|uniref:SpaH/EbpB family LPXTG-anchored major pilin n=1 Tax=uncultured Clostridium sp. TaxID=59620 RepID=UPI002601BE70|nr:SpaH/EbpB family LPXTG-anchored major pilin [uncultured Clostridium sp.]
MKKLKKTLITTIIMIFMLGLVPAYAAGNGVIEIKNNPSKTGTSIKEHVFNIYKVFNLTLENNSEKKKYSYIVTEEFKPFFEEEQKKDTENKDMDLNEFAKSYITEKNKEEVAKKLMEYVNENSEQIKDVITTSDANMTTDENKIETVKVSGLDLGYYLIIDKGVNGSGEGKIIARAAMGTTDSKLTIDLKAKAPTIEKEIKGDDGEFGNVSDSEIGDEVEYRFISTIPDVTGYETYKYIIHDKMTKGLTFNNNIEIYIGEKNTEKKLSKDYYNVIVNPTHTGETSETHTFDIDINIIKAVKDGVLNVDDKLYTYFTATLNEDAVTAGDSNDNSVNLEYSNNPYDKESGDKTPIVTVKDYTFKLNVLKTKEDGETGLKGAEFEIRNGETPVYFINKNGNYIVCPEDHNHSEIDTCTKTIVSGDNGKFSISGLDDNFEYTIVETKAPDGYNPIKPIKFTITAEYDKDGNITGITTNVGSIVVQGDTFELGTTIVNKTDLLLPGTGGMGTAIFTVLGGIMMVAAGATLLKRRKAN